jgi:hypothetical protein
MLFLVSKLVTGFASTGVLVEPHRDGEVATRRLVLAHEHRLQAEQAARAPEQRRRGDTSARASISPWLRLLRDARAWRVPAHGVARVGRGASARGVGAGGGRRGAARRAGVRLGPRRGRGASWGPSAAPAARDPAPAGGGFRTHACARSLSQETFREKRTNRQSIANLGVSERSKKTPHPQTSRTKKEKRYATTRDTGAPVTHMHAHPAPNSEQVHTQCTSCCAHTACRCALREPYLSSQHEAGAPPGFESVGGRGIGLGAGVRVVDTAPSVGVEQLRARFGVKVASSRGTRAVLGDVAPLPAGPGSKRVMSRSCSGGASHPLRLEIEARTGS